MGIAAIVAAVVVAGATAYGSYASGQRKKGEQAVNFDRWLQDQAQREKFFNESRGSTGHAILPTYLGNFESLSGLDAVENYNALNKYYGVGEDRLGRIKKLSDAYAPMQAQATDVAAGIFSGKNTEDRLGFAAPVQAERLSYAKGQAQGIDSGLLAIQNRLAAINARQGFQGGGSFANNQMLASTIEARQAAAQATGGARLLNAQEIAAIRNAGLDKQLANLDMPLGLARNAQAFNMLPADANAQITAAQMSPFNFYRIGTAMAPYTPQPQYESSPGIGEVVAGGIAAGASTYAGGMGGGGYGSMASSMPRTTRQADFAYANVSAPTWGDYSGYYGGYGGYGSYGTVGGP